MDGAVGVPGTRFRIGLDPLLGLIPGVGDLAGAALSGYIVTIAARLGAPPSVLARMLGNVAVDMLIGAIPGVGDLFDFGWKANTRNLALIERYRDAPERVRRSSRLAVAAALGGIGLLVAGGIWLGVAVLRAIL